ncbi:hypothetical protein TorRG33x02_280060 [Trema orientale]|uniref:Uncharacterized protein n=1 Tax=Trema orientale TaxID=63057 RepID=A0A2P5CMH5_TREOI|nr:hypothetical protein TorRG33x02_280060 [Trema orientale]
MLPINYIGGLVIFGAILHHLIDQACKVVEATFNIDPKAKKKTLEDVGKYWRNFKTFMTKELVYKYKDTFPSLLENPPPAYMEWIDPKDWKDSIGKK